MSFPQLSCLDPSFWDYKNEGFDSIILSWNGVSQSELHNKVLRIFKNQYPEYFRTGMKQISDFTEKVTILQKYVNILSNYLPEIDGGSPVLVTDDFLQSISHKIEESRPHRRRKESFVCLTARVAILHDDHTPPNSLVFEIKPKWGFLPSCPLIPKDSPKLNISRFQLLQYTKLQTGVIKSISNYDPLDLFSGNSDRIRKAVDSLFENPQGNLKIFRDQQLIEFNKDCLQLREQLCNLIIDQLSDSILRKLLNIQKLDIWDIECLPPIIQKAGNVTWNDLINDEDVIKGVTNMIEGQFQFPKTPNEYNDLSMNMSKEEARIFIAAFCISCAAKDCSLMFLLEHDIPETKIFIIDFDLKLPELLITNYLNNDKKIIQTYLDLHQ